MNDSKIKVLWYWQAMGPYHFARMRELARVPGIELTVVECTSLDDHGWIRGEDAKDLHVITLSTEPLSSRILRETQHAFARILNESCPDVIVGPGYAEAYSLQVILAYRNSNPDSLALVWSESTLIDHPRKHIKEGLKSLVISAFDGALVAGSPHASYLRRLGMPAAVIRIVGNCIDNELFSARADEVRRTDGTRNGPVCSKFFLFVGRMLPEKNVTTLIEAYREYRQRAGSDAWELVLVGSGPEESSLRTQVTTSRTGGVRFAGLLQFNELSPYYGHAGCLVLPSISEPWGLVVNEAMASRIPVLVSNRCGCAPDLVRDGKNGFVFNPTDAQALADLLFRMSHGDVSLESLGLTSQEIVAGFTPSLFAQRAAEHISSLSERRVSHLRSFSARQSLTRMALRGIGAMTTVRDRLPIG